MPVNANSPLQRALFGGQPGRRQRYREYYEGQQQEGEAPVQVPEAPPEEPTQVAQAVAPGLQQQQQPQASTQAPMAGSFQRTGGPIDQLFGTQQQPPERARPQPAPMPPSSAPEGRGRGTLDSLLSQPTFSSSGAPNPPPVVDEPTPSGPPQRDVQASQTYAPPPPSSQTPPSPGAPPVAPPPAPGAGAPPSDFRRGLTALYRTMLGRDPGPEDFQSHAQHENNPNGLQIIGEAIRVSPEYQQRLASGGAPVITPPAPGGALPGSENWDTDEYAKPQFVRAASGGPLPGYDAKNWADPNMQTPKYVVGRILSNYPPSPEGLAQAIAEIQKAYPGATFDGKDKITIPGVGTTDVLVNAPNPGEQGSNMSWAWQDQTEAGLAPFTPALPPGEGGEGGEQIDPIRRALIAEGIEPGTPFFDLLMAELQAAQRPRTSNQPTPPPPPSSYERGPISY